MCPRRRSVPVDRVLPDDEARRGERRLLGVDVDQIVGVERIQVAQFDAGAARGGDGVQQRAVDARGFELGVGG